MPTQGPMVRVVALTEETRKQLSELEKEQFPFALAKTLTEIAEGSVQSVRQQTRRAFKLRSGEFIPKGIRKLSARKSDIRTTGVGKAVVFTQDRISGFMPIHEEGGMRSPSAFGEGIDKGKYLVYPGEALQRMAYRTARGAVKKRYKPGTLLNDLSTGKLPPNVFARVVTGKGIRRRKGKPFIIRGRAGGVPMIARRISNTQYPIQILYVFTKRAQYRKQWRFEPTVHRYVEDNFQRILQNNLRMAVETATRK